MPRFGDGFAQTMGDQRSRRNDGVDHPTVDHGADDFAHLGNRHGAGILKSAYLKGVPVYIPAFTDSEMGLDVATWSMGQRIDKARSSEATPSDDLAVLKQLHQTFPRFNPYHDLNS